MAVVFKGLQSFFEKEAAVKEAAGPIAETTVDPAVVGPLLEELSGLLESDLMEAGSRIEALRPHLEHSSVKDQFSRLIKHMDSFDTDNASKILGEIADALNISIKENG